jgi:uncharacterized protein YdhG (YjbR/CyaY superfamily)
MSLIDDYLKTIEPSKRKQLERIRMLAKEIVPSAEETISYKMPTLKYEGKAFLGFDSHADHIGAERRASLVHRLKGCRSHPTGSSDL